MSRSGSSMGKLVSVGLVLVLLALGLSVLLPSLSRSRGVALKRAMQSRGEYAEAAPSVYHQSGEDKPAPAPAKVTDFDATIDLRPMLSVGTEVAESIYEASFKASLTARSPAQGNSSIALPLPPQLISLADLKVTVDGAESSSVQIDGDRLVWLGPLPEAADAKVEIVYTAVGKGLYTLQKPNQGIIDTFKTAITAHHSDLRMTDLSLQPSDRSTSSDSVTYVWDYKKLLVARPIVIDVLGIAGVDRLSELGWLGPISVLLFGLLVSVVALALQPEKLNGWMLLLIAGCFAAAYPLMYFLQEHMPLQLTMLVAGAGVLAIIAVRSVTLFGWRVGLGLGVALPAAFMSLTLVATVHPRVTVQGLVLTIEAILTLVVAMTFLPAAQKNLAVTKPVPPPPPAAS